MLEIRWHDGMMFCVGCIKNENTCYITTISDALGSRNNPLSVVKVNNRADLQADPQVDMICCRPLATLVHLYTRP